MVSKRMAFLGSRALLVGALSITCAAACVAFCLGAWLLAWLITEQEDVEYPQTIVEKTVAIDTSALAERPTEEDWYAVAVQVLDEEGWDLDPNLTMISALVPCSAEPALGNLEMHFADAYLDGLMPHLNMATVSLDRATNTASIEIAYQALRWKHSTLDLGKVSVGLYEALEIAGRHSGQEFADGASHQCEASIYLIEYEWRIGFRESGHTTWPDWRMLVNAQTGEVKRVAWW